MGPRPAKINENRINEPPQANKSRTTGEQRAGFKRGGPYPCPNFISQPNPINAATKYAKHRSP
jgi:hypothetical protein